MAASAPQEPYCPHCRSRAWIESRLIISISLLSIPEAAMLGVGLYLLLAAVGVSSIIGGIVTAFGAAPLLTRIIRRYFCERCEIEFEAADKESAASAPILPH